MKIPIPALFFFVFFWVILFLRLIAAIYCGDLFIERIKLQVPNYKCTVVMPSKTDGICTKTDFLLFMFFYN